MAKLHVCVCAVLRVDSLQRGRVASRQGTMMRDHRCVDVTGGLGVPVRPPASLPQVVVHVPTSWSVALRLYPKRLPGPSPSYDR